VIYSDPVGGIPILRGTFACFVSSFHPDICSKADVASLFRVQPLMIQILYYSFTPFLNLHLHLALSTPSCFFWDVNILELLLPAAKVIRNSNQHPSTMNFRPNFALLIVNLCPWRGEEMDDKSAKPRDNCLTNLSGSMMLPYSFLVSVFMYITLLPNDAVKDLPVKAIR